MNTEAPLMSDFVVADFFGRNSCVKDFVQHGFVVVGAGAVVLESCSGDDVLLPYHVHEAIGHG